MPIDGLGRNFLARNSCVAHLLEIKKKNQSHKHSLGKRRLGTRSVKKCQQFELSANLIGCEFREMLGCMGGIIIFSLVVN